MDARSFFSCILPVILVANWFSFVGVCDPASREGFPFCVRDSGRHVWRLMGIARVPLPVVRASLVKTGVSRREAFRHHAIAEFLVSLPCLCPLQKRQQPSSSSLNTRATPPDLSPPQPSPSARAFPRGKCSKLSRTSSVIGSCRITGPVCETTQPPDTCTLDRLHLAHSPPGTDHCRAAISSFISRIGRLHWA